MRIRYETPLTRHASAIDAILSAYIPLQARLQRTPNRCGTFADLSSLGEPKFLVSAAAFDEPWGRPQRDGPALRALALMRHLQAYNASNPALWSSTEPPGAAPWFSTLYEPALPAESVIKADLEYVSHGWGHAGFDVWEEVEGLHFFTAMVQLRALAEGAALARAFGDGGAAAWYARQHGQLRALVGRFWDPRRGTLAATLESPRSGLDCAVLLGALHGTADEDEEAAAADAVFPPWSDEVLLSLHAFLRDQHARFPINAAAASPLAGIALGRYPEDMYDGVGARPAGARPWFLCTAAAAELLHRAATHLARQPHLLVSGQALPFWQAVDPRLETGPLAQADPAFRNAISRLRAAGDGFLDVVRRHADARTGALSEQFDGTTGAQRGARDLTWSYGALLEALHRRRGKANKMGVPGREL